ncbi:hypothetical protein FA13DRAFT_1373323 [Coprinellus micaceus]|uniref:Uncharacterized protein n=1 Tax=Coprinellus micaceus TaxID=71717 RepID=A0A4Y7TNI0_COPMI|nr:hypothetical protein FA13DRAFT_1373323 [Coprinellus micaceus]
MYCLKISITWESKALQERRRPLFHPVNFEGREKRLISACSSLCISVSGIGFKWASYFALSGVPFSFSRSAVLSSLVRSWELKRGLPPSYRAAIKIPSDPTVSADLHR